MKYVLNKSRYAMLFKLEDENGIPRKIEFDRQRFYKDTGNLATTGVTEIDDDVYKELEKIEEFQKLFDRGDFVLTDKPVSVAESQAQLKQKDAEIADLKKKLVANDKPDVKKLKEESKKKDTEIADLKAQLEALKKNKDGGSSDTAGF